MKYLKSYDSNSAYQEALGNGDILTPSVVMVEGKLIYKSIPATDAGDICVWDKADEVYRFIKYAAYNESYYQDRTMIPIGVVAVPSTHTPDGSTRVMSLVNMSLKTPDTGVATAGAVEGDNYMYWGASGNIDGLANRGTVTKVNPLTGETTGTTDWVRIPSDHKFTSTGYVDPVSGDYYYYNNYTGDDSYDGTKEDRFGPSPYTREGNKNPQYYTNATSDFDGRGNTDKILTAATVSWSSGAISNSTDAGNYPAATTCSRFYTKGTKQGDWYLPAIGEAMFLVARHVEINNGIKAVAKGGWSSVIVGDNTNSGTYGYWCWSSSPYNSSFARNVPTNTGYVNYYSRATLTSGNRVRSFLAL